MCVQYGIAQPLKIVLDWWHIFTFWFPYLELCLLWQTGMLLLYFCLKKGYLKLSSPSEFKWKVKIQVTGGNFIWVFSDKWAKLGSLLKYYKQLWKTDSKLGSYTFIKNYFLDWKLRSFWSIPFFAIGPILFRS